MSDTSQLKQDVEEHVRSWLANRYSGRKFTSSKVGFDGGGRVEFDAVSDDGTIVAAILANRAKTRSGNDNTGGLRKALLDLCQLRLLPARHSAKLMVLTDQEFIKRIEARAKKSVGKGDVQLLYCPLPPPPRSNLSECGPYRKQV